MASIDVESLLGEVSPAAPSGANLEYDAAYLELMRAAQGTPEQQMGQVIVPAQEPQWKVVQKGSIELLGRTKDLAVAMKLVESSMHLDGFSGLRDSLGVLRGMLEKFWETLHPQLDPADNNDPLARLNLLGSLGDPEAMLRGLQEIPLANSRSLGRFGLHDINLAEGKIPPPTGVTPPKPEVIEGAFKETPAEELSNLSMALDQCLENLKAIDAALAAKVGQGKGPNLAETVRVIRDAKAQVAKRTGGATPDNIAGGDAPAGGGAPGRGVSGDINSGADVVALLDKICDYFVRNEPSSPVPLLLKRAKRLVSKDFLSVIRDLTPEALDKLGIITGTEPEAKKE